MSNCKAKLRKEFLLHTINCSSDLHGLGALALLGARLHPDHDIRLQEQEHHQTYENCVQKRTRKMAQIS
jgi:hypothetical protein